MSAALEQWHKTAARKLGLALADYVALLKCEAVKGGARMCRRCSPYKLLPADRFPAHVLGRDGLRALCCECRSLDDAARRALVEAGEFGAV